MDGIEYNKEDFNITIRHYGDTYSAHCWHRPSESDGHSWSNFTTSEDNHWEMVKTHIRVHHTKTKKESTGGAGTDITGQNAADSGNGEKAGHRNSSVAQ